MREGIRDVQSGSIGGPKFQTQVGRVEGGGTPAPSVVEISTTSHDVASLLGTDDQGRLPTAATAAAALRASTATPAPAQSPGAGAETYPKIADGLPSELPPDPNMQGFITAGPRYLWSLDELRHVSLADLGPLQANQYEKCRAQALEIGAKFGVASPKLVVGIIQKPAYGGISQPYPIVKDEWNQFAEDAKTMCESIPHVHVVDGTRYTAPI